MNAKKQNPTQTEQDVQFMLVSNRRIQSLEQKIDELHELLIKTESVTGQQLSGFLTEKQAMELLQRSHTWFWERRKSGELVYSKVGRTIYYKQDDLLALLKVEQATEGQ